MVFGKIFFGEHEETGRSGYGNTWEEAYNYALSSPHDHDAAGGDMFAVKVTAAWKCWHSDHPMIVSFGQSKTEALDKLFDCIENLTQHLRSYAEQQS